MRIVLAALTLTLALALLPSYAIPDTASMKRMQGSVNDSLKRSGEKFTSATNHSRKPGKG